MPKLYFRYGTMASAKTANLLMAAHNYAQSGQHVLLVKSAMDTRPTNIATIESRCGLTKNAHVVVSPTMALGKKLNEWDLTEMSAVLVDECQFLTHAQVDDLRHIAAMVPVVCYGLRTDYRGRLFSGSHRLMEVADSMEEVKTGCVACKHKAIMNARYVVHEGHRWIDRTGDQIEVGGDERYMALCWACYNKEFV